MAASALTGLDISLALVYFFKIGDAMSMSEPLDLVFKESVQ